MREDFVPIFEELYRTYRPAFTVRDRRERVLHPRFAKTHIGPDTIRATIERATEKTEVAELMRPDAKLLLLVNLYLLISLPEYRERWVRFSALGSPAKTPENLMQPAIQVQELLEDLESVLTAAREQVFRQDGREISGHVVIDALHGRWSRLKLAAAKIWG